MSDTITTEMIKNISLFEKLEDSDLEKLISVVQKGVFLLAQNSSKKAILVMLSMF